ncbi:MAG TPA: hypothetical protein ENG74_02100 [Thermoplasmatales archaeon]|nr:hypothetical protein [Thermoplasmatales archaeon]
MKKKSSRSCEKAVVAVIDVVLISLIVLLAIGSITMWAIPYLERQKAINSTQFISHQFEVFNSLLLDVCKEGENSSRCFPLYINDGKVDLDCTGDMLVIWYSLVKPEINFAVSNISDGDEGFDISFNREVRKIEKVKYTWLDNGTEREGWVDNRDNKCFIRINEPINSGRGIKIELFSREGPVGQIWAFYPGRLRFSFPTSEGDFAIEAIGGGIIRGEGDSADLSSSIPFYRINNALVIRCIQMNFSTDIRSICGKGMHIFTITNNKTSILENQKVYWIYAEMHGENEKLKILSSQSANLILLHSICTISLQEENR